MPSPSSHTETLTFEPDVTRRSSNKSSKNNGLLIRSTTNPNYLHNNGLPVSCGTGSGKKYLCDEDPTGTTTTTTMMMNDDNISLGGNGSGGGNILLQPMQQQQQQQPDQQQTSQQQEQQAIVVNYTGGTGGRSSAVPQIVKFSHNSVQDRKQCYCKVKDIRSRIIVLIVAVLVLGTAIGALTMYFSGNLQCGRKNGE